MLSCPNLDWTSDSEADITEQVAALLKHYDEKHGEGLPEDARELIRACARALGGSRV